jgi:hypothetical protein
MIATFLAFLIAASLAVSACGRQPIETVPTGTVDTLTFVLGDPSLWPRHGTQFQDQIVDRVRREVCWVKYRDARAFECWRWDDRWIYHEVDHALDGDSTGRSYRFSDGRWLPRRLSGVWTLDLPRNRAIDLSPDCREQSRPFPYRMRAHVDSASDLGASIGIRSTLVLEYQPYALGQPPPPETVERFSFAEGAGWYAWESARGSARFDVLGGPAMTRGRWCGDTAGSFALLPTVNPGARNRR